MKPNRNKKSPLNYLFGSMVCVVIVGLLSLSFFGNGDSLIDLILGPVESGREVVSKPNLTSKETQTSQRTEISKPASLPFVATVPQPPAVRKNTDLRVQEEEPQPEPPVVDVRADEHPTERIRRMNLGVPPQYTKEVKLPRNMDLKRPPRWNKTLASPAVPKEAPDPFSPPPIKVDPRRLPQEEVERLTIGE